MTDNDDDPLLSAAVRLRDACVRQVDGWVAHGGCLGDHGDDFTGLVWRGYWSALRYEVKLGPAGVFDAACILAKRLIGTSCNEADINRVARVLGLPPEAHYIRLDPAATSYIRSTSLHKLRDSECEMKDDLEHLRDSYGELRKEGLHSRGTRRWDVWLASGVGAIDGASGTSEPRWPAAGDPLLAAALGAGSWKVVKEALWRAAWSGRISLRGMMASMLALYRINQASWVHTWSSCDYEAMNDIEWTFNSLAFVTDRPRALAAIGDRYGEGSMDCIHTVLSGHSAQSVRGSTLTRVRLYMYMVIARGIRRYRDQRLTPGTSAHARMVEKKQAILETAFISHVSMK